MKMIGMATLGRDAEIRRTPGGDTVCNLSLAVSFYDKGAENNRGTQWINATLWGERAEKLAQFLTKGSKHCFTLSDVRMRKYADKDGYDAYSLDARVDDVELGPKREGEGGGSSAPGGGGQRRPANGSASTHGNTGAQAGKPASGFDDMDDDIPF